MGETHLAFLLRDVKIKPEHVNNSDKTELQVMMSGNKKKKLSQSEMIIRL